jgi:F-type H+-transporting ATPase subunit gamma
LPNTIDLRRRIRSVKNTQQITKAMKMVAAAKLRRAQDRIMAARPYAAALREVLSSVAARVEAEDHPLLQQREEKNVLLLVVTADKGLCGAFNTNTLKAAQSFIREKQSEGLELIAIGRKATDYFKRRSMATRYQAINIFSTLSHGDAREIANIIASDYTEQKIDAVYVVYNEFRSVIQQIVRTDRLLPLERPGKKDEGEPEIEYLFEPGPQQILAQLLPKHLEFQIYRILLESAAAEHGARMTAMESATKNASELIQSLTLTYNRIRQAAITKEIIEIVSGAQAMK